MSGIEAVLRIERELSSLTQLGKHPNIVRFDKALHGLQSLYIITEGFTTDLFDFISDNQLKLSNPYQSSNIAAGK